MKNLRVLFMGTPEFAVATLGSLLMNGYDIVAAVTSPDKPAGRGRKISESAVKKFAVSNCIPVIQPDNLKDPGFIENLRKLKPDVIIVVAFRMIPEVVWRIPPKGTINLHASLLPQYRGAAPVNHVIINGETRTGVTTFLIDDRIDTGNILMREEVPISPFENAGELHDKLMKHGARLVIRTLEGIAGNSLTPQPQSNFMIPGEVIHTAPRIFPENCIVNWNNTAQRIHNFIRGLSPYPCARSEFSNENKRISFKIFESEPEPADHDHKPGDIISDGRSFIRVACKEGFVKILSLQLEGKSRVTAEEFLRGFRIADYVLKVS